MKELRFKVMVSTEYGPEEYDGVIYKRIEEAKAVMAKAQNEYLHLMSYLKEV